VPTEAGCAVEMMTIDPMDLQAVHEQDVAMLAVYSVWEGRRSLRPDYLPNRGNIGRPANPRNQ